MFDRTKFEALASENLNLWDYRSAYRGLSYCIYPQHAFSLPDSEQMIRIARAPKEIDDSGLKFWINAEFLDDWRDRESYFQPYLAASLFRPIDEQEFNRLVREQVQGLVVPIDLPLHPLTGFVGGLAMYTMERDFVVSVFAEYEDEFIHFFWNTTA